MYVMVKQKGNMSDSLQKNVTIRFDPKKLWIEYFSTERWSDDIVDISYLDYLIWYVEYTV